MASRGAGPLPTFLIIGAPKAGTTALAGYLASHPDVFVAPEKEVHFFDRQFDRGLDWYRGRFSGATTERAVGEASPTYMYGRKTLDRIASVLPDVRLVAVLRDPVDRAYSHYWWEHAITESRTFSEAVRAEMADGSGGRRGRYLDGGLYRERLEKAAATFGRESLHVVIQEELRAEPAKTFGEVCRFIGVDASFSPPTLGDEVNPAYRLRLPWLRRAMFRIRAGRRFPRGWVEAIDRWNRVAWKYPPMDEGTRAELEAWYAEENAALARWLDRDLSVWSRRER